MVETGLTIRDLLRRGARARGDKTAVTHVRDGAAISTVSYQDLFGDANLLANRMLASGLSKGDRIAVIAENSYDFCRLVLAAANAGLVAASINVLLSDEDMKAVLDELQPAVIAGDSHIIDRYGFSENDPSPAQRIWRFPLDETELIQVGGDGDRGEPAVELSPDDPCLVLYTSGSTGTPRGVILTHRSLMMNAWSVSRSWGFRSDDRILLGLPMYHVSIWNTTLMPTLLAGATGVIVNGLNTATIFRQLHETRVTVALALPYMFKVVVDESLSSPLGKPPLRLALYGMAGMPTQLAESLRKGLGIAMASGFGQTESGGNTIVLDDVDHDEKCGSLGRPLPNVDVELLDNQGHVIPPRSSIVGEVVYRGPSVSIGYLDSEPLDPDAPAEWFHSGDLAYEDSDGFFWFQGRTREVIKSGGENVYAAKVEQVLAAIHGITDVAVVGRASERWGEEVVAFVVIDRAVDLDEEKIRDLSRPHLAPFEVPKQVRIIDAIPKSAAGKTAKRLLPED